jgi:uncharacterized protein (TIGR00297 family)
MLGLLQLASLAEALPSRNLVLFLATSVAFACFGRLSRGVTNGGALTGAIVCFLLLWAGGFGSFAALLAVFALTWASTRFGYARKQRLGIAESRTGRDFLQVLANLGIAGSCALAFVYARSPGLIVAMSSALAEAAADTVSSEIGQAAGGQPRLITNWDQVDPGTDGAVTLVGSLAGILAAILIAVVCWMTGLMPVLSAGICVIAAIGGMITDSLIGATLERQSKLGNNSVNFLSTAVAAALAFLFYR